MGDEIRLFSKDDPYPYYVYAVNGDFLVVNRTTTCTEFGTDSYRGCVEWIMDKLNLGGGGGSSYPYIIHQGSDGMYRVIDAETLATVFKSSYTSVPSLGDCLTWIRRASYEPPQQKEQIERLTKQNEQLKRDYDRLMEETQEHITQIKMGLRDRAALAGTIDGLKYAIDQLCRAK